MFFYQPFWSLEFVYLEIHDEYSYIWILYIERDIHNWKYAIVIELLPDNSVRKSNKILVDKPIEFGIVTGKWFNDLLGVVYGELLKRDCLY